MRFLDVRYVLALMMVVAIAVGSLAISTPRYLGSLMFALWPSKSNTCPNESGSFSDNDVIDACTAVIERLRAENVRGSGLDGLRDALMLRGKAYQRRHKIDPAITDFDDALVLDPSNVAVLLSRGGALSEKGDFKRAIGDYNTAIQLKPASAEAFSGRAQAYERNADHDHAIADYNQVIQLGPNRADAFANRGDVYSAKGEYDNAIASYDEAIHVDPRSAMAFDRRGHFRGQRQDYVGAIADLKESIRLDPKAAYAFKDLGDVYRANSDFDAAIIAYTAAIDLASDNFKARENRALAYGAKGDHAREREEIVATTRQGSGPSVRTIIVDSDGQIYLDSIAVTIDDLAAQLIEQRVALQKGPVVLRTDVHAKYQRFMDVLDVLSRLGITDVGMATKPSDD